MKEERKKDHIVLYLNNNNNNGNDDDNDNDNNNNSHHDLRYNHNFETIQNNNEMKGF